jgi:aminodeoxyfutalosine deaminase
MMDFLQSLPKAELHLHLEGSIAPGTLQELRPELSREEILSHYQYADFSGFLKSYGWVTRFLERPEHYALITRRLLEYLAAQGVRYAELNLSVGVMLWRGQDAAANFDAIAGEAARSPFPVRFIFDAVRQFPLDQGRRVAELAAERIDRGVVAFGIGGDEARGPAEWFKEIFAFGKAAGLHLAPHAGEIAGPESVWTALELGAERIGHGIRSIEDPALLDHLRRNDIPLEISISSNVCTQAVPTLAAHPVRRLYDAGVPVVLNTDDPAMFHSTLVDEYRIAHEAFGFSHEELRGLAANSFRYAFTRVAGDRAPAQASGDPVPTPR